MYEYETTYLYLKEKFKYGTPVAKRGEYRWDDKNINGSAKTVGGCPCRPRRREKTDHRRTKGSNRGEVEGKQLPLTREYEAEQMSTMKDEGKHRGHGKRKVPPQWREMKTKGRERRREAKMKYKNKNQSLTAKHTRHVIHTLPPHTLTVLRRPPALEVERELVNRQQRNWSRFCERSKNERSTSAHAHRKRTGNGEENADQARVPVACGKRRSGKTRARASIGAAATGRRRRQYAEEREDDQRERRTGYRMGTGGTRGRRVRGRESERASGEESGLRGGTAEGGSDVTGTHARWLSGNKYISDKGGREICNRSEMGWNAHIDKGANME
ncbi:hypothetical protein B0H14DRAFT_3169625 [Mycena olivaceomarginata]|nr:hypothetical protein B0H14DRAFT_3169625 [Mycena olivaceomarginata]